MAIELRTLGALQLRGPDGREQESLLAQPRRVALLAYLALAAPRGYQRRDKLLALFWPDQDEQHARNALSQALHFLRRTLGADAIVSRGDDEIGLDPALFWCDAIAFESALDAGRLEEALDLYRGPLLEGFHISAAAPELAQWMDGERDRLARRYGKALQSMASGREAAGDHAAAAGWYRRLAALQPLDTGVALGMMRALAASGDRTGAIRHARVHEALLREELGTVPDPRIDALVRELQQPPRESPPPAYVAPQPASVGAIAPASPPPRPGGALWRRGRSVAVGVVILLLSTILVSYARHTIGARRIQCLAVLPFDDLASDSAHAYVADALSDAVITELARYDQLRIISRTSLIRYRHAPKPLPQIGEELNCDGVMTGTIVRQGPYMRADVQILYAPDDRHLWAEYYQSDTADILTLESRVADGVARAARELAVVHSDGPRRPARRVDPIVVGMYLRGRDVMSSRNPAALRQAITLFEQAIERDSTYAPAWAGLCDSYGFISSLGYGPNVAYTDSARMMARRALAADSSSSEAHTSYATVFGEAGDWDRSDAEFRKAIALDPANALAHHWYALLLATLDRRDEAVREVRLAHDLDPMSQAAIGAKMQIEIYAGVRVARGRPGSRQQMIDPTHPGTVASHAIGLARNGKCAEAYTESERAQQLAPDNTPMLISLVGVHALCHEPAKARALLDQVEQRPDARRFAVYIAEVYSFEHLPDSAFAWLDRSDWGMPSRFELRTATLLAPLRTDPRYRQLLTRMGLP